MVTKEQPTANLSAEVNIKNYKKQIEALRKQLAHPVVLRNAEKTQQIHDQIDELKRKIEEATRNTRRAVPVTNAPIVGQRKANGGTRRSRHFSI